MNKKFKRMLATVSAIATCAVSMVSMTSGAVFIKNDMGINFYTVSFTADGLKYGVWQEMNDYFNNIECYKFFISEDGEHNIALMYDERNISIWHFNGYMLRNAEDVPVLEKYLSDNNIEYTKEDFSEYVSIKPTEYNVRSKEYFQLAQKIKEDTGFIQGTAILCGITNMEVTDIEIELPEPTLAGDANEDGTVNISDAVLIMQSITNPSEYELTIQGMANADIVDNDGVTLLDALRIQEIQAGI